MTDNIKNYTHVATDLAGCEVYGWLAPDKKRLVRPGLTIKIQPNSYHTNPQFKGDNVIAKLYRGVATGENKYIAGKTYVGKLDFSLVSGDNGEYRIVFEDEQGWNIVPVFFESIEPIPESQPLFD